MKRWTTAITAIVKHSGNPIGTMQDMPEDFRSSLKELRSRILRQDTQVHWDTQPEEQAGQPSQQKSAGGSSDGGNNVNNESRPAPPTIMRSISRIWEEEEAGAGRSGANSNLIAAVAESSARIKGKSPLQAVTAASTSGASTVVASSPSSGLHDAETEGKRSGGALSQMETRQDQGREEDDEAKIGEDAAAAVVPVTEEEAQRGDGIGNNGAGHHQIK